MTAHTAGLYIHIPFCSSKCAYCDFYSFPAGEDYKRRCTLKECEEIESAATRGGLRFDTVYLGGGTPTVLGNGNLATLLERAGKYTCEGAEITSEANPSSALGDTIAALKDGGVNRISFGLQSSDKGELFALGRIHTPEDFTRAAALARGAGIENISADIMIGIPIQTIDSLKRSIDFAVQNGVTHVSAYMLKIEKNTAFGRNPPELPGEDETAEMYLAAVERLRENGLEQYEISNFARPGFESRHNLKYWQCGEYLGVGPAAHSFLDGIRSYHTRSLDDYLAGAPAINDGKGGSDAEKAMLALRLTRGAPLQLLYRAAAASGVTRGKTDSTVAMLCENGLATVRGDNLSLTAKGFLLSNSVTGRLLFG